MSNDYMDLRLRLTREADAGWQEGLTALFKDADDAIATLRADNERLRAAAKDAIGALSEFGEAWTNAAVEQARKTLIAACELTERKVTP